MCQRRQTSRMQGFTHQHAIGSRRRHDAGQLSVLQEQLRWRDAAALWQWQAWCPRAPFHSVWTATAALATPQALAVTAQILKQPTSSLLSAVCTLLWGPAEAEGVSKDILRTDARLADRCPWLNLSSVHARHAAAPKRAGAGASSSGIRPGVPAASAARDGCSRNRTSHRSHRMRSGLGESRLDTPSPIRMHAVIFLLARQLSSTHCALSVAGPTSSDLLSWQIGSDRTR